MTTETKHMPSEREIEAAAEALARTALTPKGKIECVWPDDWSRDERQMYRNQATAALTVQVPAGWKMVPVYSARHRTIIFVGESIKDDIRALLAASPPAPASQVLTEEERRVIDDVVDKLAAVGAVSLSEKLLAIMDRITNKTLINN